MKCYKINILGQIHKRDFRFYAMQKAYQVGVRGYVFRPGENSVVLEAEGEEDALGRFVEWCKMGPMGSRIENVSFFEKEICNYSSFDYKG